MRVTIGALLLLLCAWRTHERAQAWRSDVALWTSAVVSSPTRARPALNLAMAFARLGRWADAEHWTRHTLQRMTPRDVWMQPYLCNHLNRLAVLSPQEPSWSGVCAS
jgi:hypothetical protein